MEEGHVELVPTYSAHRESITNHGLLECYNITEDNKDEEYQEEEDPRNVKVPKTEGECIVVGPELKANTYANPLRVCKANIGMKKKPKFVNIGDYWNDETVENIVDLLCEYQDLFPTTFLEMKGIARELGEMNITIKLYAKPII
jgi:hypothetical protein